MIRPLESHKHKALCFASAVAWRRGQREAQERTSASSASSVHPSILPLPSSSQQVASFDPGRERLLWSCRLRHHCVIQLGTASLSNSPWIHTCCSFSCHIILYLLHHMVASSSSSLPCLSFLLSPHLHLLPTFLSFSLTPAVTPVSALFGPAFLSSLNWLRVMHSSDNGGVDMNRYVPSKNNWTPRSAEEFQRCSCAF